MIEFRLLGEVEVLIEGRLVDVGTARQQCVLAVLLLEPNRTVTFDAMLNRVWGDQLPQRARNALSGYVSRLRQVLANTGVRIPRGDDGYLIKVDPAAVDIHRFRRLLTQAHKVGNRPAAAALRDQALDLWRGHALDGLHGAWAESVRRTLATERLAAVLDRNEFALAIGQHARLLPDLIAWSQEYPLDERLAGQLMRTLYRCGRQADALETYRRIRQQLIEELGIDPSPPLRELHLQILNADETLAISPATDRSVVPRQLPAAVSLFAGRADELARLTSLLRTQTEGGATVVISAIGGTAGVGKTALAVYWAHQVADRFPDGQLYVNLRGFDPAGSVMDPAEALRRFLDALDVPPERIPPDLEAQAALYRTQLAGRRMLIVLDNAHDSVQVRALLPGASTCLVLVTSRNQLSGLIAADAAHPITLDLLTQGEAHQLLTRRLGADRVTAEPDAVEQIITACAQLPLALAIVAARAAAEPYLPLHTLADGLRDNNSGSSRGGGRLDTLRTDDPATDVRAVFSWSYQALALPAARLFRLLGLHPGPDTSIPAAASLASLRLPEVRGLLGELTRANLLIEHLPRRYIFHDLLRAYAAEQAHRLDPDKERNDATHRFLDHYLHTAHTAARLLNPHRDPITPTPPQPGVIPEHPTDYQQAMDWFTAEHPVLLAAVEHAASTGFDTHAWQLAWTLADFLDWRGHWHDQTAVQQAAVAAAGRLADPTAQARAHRDLAYAYTQLGRLDDAHTQLRHALDMTAQAGDLVGQAYTHDSLTYLWERRGRIAEAMHHAHEALDLYQAAGHRQGQALALGNIGWCHALLGDHQQALTYCQQVLSLFQELDDRHGQAGTWDSLGYAHHHLGRPDQAIACYQRALDMFRDLGDRYNEASTFTRLGDTHHTTGNPEAARDAWQRALTILEQLGHPNAQAVHVKLHHPDQTPPGNAQNDRKS